MITPQIYNITPMIFWEFWKKFNKKNWLPLKYTL